ncbi:MAG: helix-turn-helix transcriptional regulator [Proteobacteria bacterium]|nr:helix-turn-helix transcriptional regulator [Pseudomonadota bacterium]
MSALTNVQIIKGRNGEPAFAVLPYKEYLRLAEKHGTDDVTIPHEVVEILIDRQINLVKAWRIHLGLTQKQVAKRAGISQAALSQMEKTDNVLRTATLEKLADAMGLSVEQLRD